MRPGRLDRIVYVGPPDQVAREEILNIRTRSMSVEPGFDVAEIARIVSISLALNMIFIRLPSDIVWAFCRPKDVQAQNLARCAKRRHY